MSPHTIIPTYENIPNLVKKYRSAKKRIVLTQGSFDMIHIGHARYCAEAKKHGDVLIVAVDSDEKVKKRKGDDRPIVPESERVEMLAHLKAVDHVILKPIVAPKWELIKIIRPDTLITTRETYNEKQIAELEKICGEVVVLEPMATTSTSAKLRLVQLGVAKRVTTTLTNKLIKTMESVLDELKEQQR